MSGKSGSRPTGRKPDTIRRQSAKTDGAHGKEQAEQVQGGDQNVDKAVRRRITTRRITK